MKAPIDLLKDKRDEIILERRRVEKVPIGNNTPNVLGFEQERQDNIHQIEKIIARYQRSIDILNSQLGEEI